MIGDRIAVVACVGHTVRVTEGGEFFLANMIPMQWYMNGGHSNFKQKTYVKF